MSTWVGAPLERGPAVFHPSVLYTSGKGSWSVVRHYVGVSVVPVCMWGAGGHTYVYAGVMSARWLPSPDPVVGAPDPGHPGNAAPAPAPGPYAPPSLWAPELAFVSFIGGQKGGSGHCGNSSGILGIQLFWGQGGAWKTPPKPGQRALRGLV